MADTGDRISKVIRQQIRTMGNVNRTCWKAEFTGLERSTMQGEQWEVMERGRETQTLVDRVDHEQPTIGYREV